MTTAWWTNWDLSYSDNMYGQIYGGHSVSEAVYHTLQEWMPAYIFEVNRKLGDDILKIPKHYRFRPEFETLAPGIEPRILVAVSGTTDEPERYQNATRATYGVKVECFVFAGQDWQEAQALTFAYMATIRAILVQQGGLGGIAELTRWMGETYLEGEHSATRTTGLGMVDFDVVLSNAIDPSAGPPSPEFAPTAEGSFPTIFPPPAVPVVDTVDVTVEIEEHV